VPAVERGIQQAQQQRQAGIVLLPACLGIPGHVKVVHQEFVQPVQVLLVLDVRAAAKHVQQDLVGHRAAAGLGRARAENDYRVHTRLT
jgi:hypothetical protein